MLGEPRGELADGRRLAGAVDADHQDHRGVVADVEDRRLPEELRNLVGECLVELRELASRFEPAHELGGGTDADVAGDERLLESLPVRLVAGVEHRRSELPCECPARPRERVAQP